jgi:hypothetical protein
MRRFLKRFVTPPLIVIAALVVVLEETLIVWLQRLMAALASLRWIAMLEARAARLGPYPALFLFLVPAVTVFIVELGGVWLATQDRIALGATVTLVGKVIGTALAARLYNVLHPALVSLNWFTRVEAWVFAWRDRLYGIVKAMPAWQATMAWVARLRAAVRGRFDRSRQTRRGWVARRLAAIRRRARRSA